FTIQSALGLLELIKKLRADCKQVASGKANDLIDVSETGPHHLGFVAIFFVVVVNASDGCNARVLVGRNFRAALLFLVPVVNASNERRDQSDSGLGTRDCLSETKE